MYTSYTTTENNEQLLDEVEQNIVICQWRADQLLICETLTNHDILRQPSSMIVLSLDD